MKKIINVLIVFIVCLNLIPVTVFAVDNNIKIFEQNNYTINYEIVNSWGNSQNITVTIKNTGITAIDNWMLDYDFNGDVVGIWNAVTAIDNNGHNYIKNAGHNAVIEPESAVTFGYTLENAMGFPDSIVMCQQEVIKENGYNVELKVIDEWEDNFNGEIIITNMTDTPIECWKLSFDSNFTIVEITDSWAASVLSSADSKYTLKGTYTNIIYGNSSAAIGFTGKKSGVPQIIDYSLSEVIKADSPTVSDNDPDLENIGQIYFKDIQSEDDIANDGSGIDYVRNQILLTARDTVSFNDIELLSESLNAEIVGYIELTNDYQLEFNTEMNTEELYRIIDELNMNPIIEFSSLNTVVEVDETYMPQDYDSNDYKKVKWGINAIKADEAWDYFDESKEENKNRNTIKIGLIDSSFDESHYDLDFKYVWKTDREIGKQSHGTHVAGIMAAKFNNVTNSTVTGSVKNIAGICPKNELYAYAIGEGPATAFEYKYALALLIGNNVRVINISQTSGDIACFGASNLDTKALNYIITNAAIIGNFLEKLIDKNYDFLIVTSAGNTNKESYTKNSKKEYGYESGGTLSGNANALYSLFFNYISNSAKDRIICVGSIEHKYVNDVEEYYFDTETCIGSRVNVLAPGKNIYSTITGNSYDSMTGTSMAAPHVAGIAGMMYSINPNLTAEEVKDYIISTASQKISTPDNSYTYGLVNAKAAVEKVLGKDGGDGDVDGDYDEKNYGIILGKVIKKNTKPQKELSEVTVTVYKNLGDEIKKAEDIKEEITNTKGEYELILPAGEYVLEFTKENYVTHREKINITENSVNKMDDIELIEYSSISVKDEKSMDFLTDVDITVKSMTDDGSAEETTKYITDESGEFIFKNKDGDYMITLVKDGYADKELEITVVDAVPYDREQNQVDEILMTPIDVRIKGTVEVYNKKTSKTTPLKGIDVDIYNEKAQTLVRSTVTDSDGNYEVKLDDYGDYTVKFKGSDQKSCTIDSNGTYTVNMLYEIEKDEDNSGGNGGNGGSGNGGGGNTGSEDTALSEDGIVIPIEVGDPTQNLDYDNTIVTSLYCGDLKSGIYVDYGEYTFRYYVEDYELVTSELYTAYHKNLLKYDVYKNDVLIGGDIITFWYERVISSINHSWLHTEYVSSVGVKCVKENDKYMVCLTYTMNYVYSPDMSDTDHTVERTNCLLYTSDTPPTIRTA